MGWIWREKENSRKKNGRRPRASLAEGWDFQNPRGGKGNANTTTQAPVQRGGEPRAVVVPPPTNEKKE